MLPGVSVNLFRLQEPKENQIYCLPTAIRNTKYPTSMKIKYCFNFREIFLNFRVYGWIPNRKLKSIKFSRKKQIEILIFNFFIFSPALVI